uniref:NADH dehydrogenase subunit 6 n=1 Tax=Sphecodes ephippius TaxID=1126396 RepID=A0A0S2LTR0_9HYME|nr:NADH dehydrogenase subunit 6 [Sphecodes ephippius]
MMYYLLMMMIIFLIMNNNISPLNFMLNLFIFTMITLFINYYMTQKSLYCFMIFLTMVSGNMIMFLYFTSLINNYYNKMIKPLIKILMISMMMIFFMTLTYYYMFNTPFKLYSINYNYSIYKIYEYPMYMLTLLMILYLLITLFFSMKICLFKHKPLRKIMN